MKIPSQYLPVMPYLIVNNAKDFLIFTKTVFDAVEQMTAPGEAGKIMHGEIKIHDAVVMFADASETWTEKTAAMFIYVDDVNEVYARGIKNKAKNLYAPEQKDYGFTAGFEDPFGNHWYIVESDK